MTKFIAVVSGKGGTGKTTTAVNLAASLNNLGRDVILLDGNLTTPNIGIHLGMDAPVGLYDILKGKNNLSEAIYLHPSGLMIIPSNVNLEPASNYNKKLSSILLDLVGKSEIVIADSATNLGEDTLSILKSSDEAIVVTNPNLPAITDALKTIKIAEDCGSVVIGVVLNRITNNRLDIPVKDVKNMLDKPIIAEIPEDKKVQESILIRHPLVYSHPNSAASIKFKRLADLLNNG
ncbi:cell division ATPase MinD [Candidatus Woesearchaeota archaeon]|nr:cell division ATPase MinD [Candidatus Woesearchaeota archaeon]